jgi:hypothetical protein
VTVFSKCLMYSTKLDFSLFSVASLCLGIFPHRFNEIQNQKQSGQQIALKNQSVLTASILLPHIPEMNSLTAAKIVSVAAAKAASVKGLKGRRQRLRQGWGYLLLADYDSPLIRRQRKTATRNLFLRYKPRTKERRKSSSRLKYTGLVYPPPGSVSQGGCCCWCEFFH